MYATISPRTDFVIQAILVVMIGAAALLIIPVSSSADEASPATAPPTTVPPTTTPPTTTPAEVAPADPAAVTAAAVSPASTTAAPTTAAPGAAIPQAVIGEWVEGTISPTTYWNTQTGQFAGNARGMAQYFTFNADGSYTQYVYIEMRTYNLVTQVWTQTAGRAEFADNTLTLTPTSGRYKTSGTRQIDRAMTADELAEKKTTYNWQIEQQDGHDILVIPFDDGSAFRLRRAQGK